MFRYHFYDSDPSKWMDTRSNSLSFSPIQFTDARWEIKQEPREFWIEMREDGYVRNASPRLFEVPDKSRLIKVREVLDDE